MSNLPHDEPSEILFSTSRMGAKLFKVLTVDAGGNARVYIRFRPLPASSLQAAWDRGEPRPDNFVEEKLVEIYVNCRLVKDHQQVILLKAKCRMPTFKVHYDETKAIVGL